jgi:hypothetical protein
MPKPATTTFDPTDYCAKIKSRNSVTYPDLVNSPALKAISRADAKALGWSAYVPFLPCRNGHVAPRFVANDSCTDCWRVSKGKVPVHGKASDKKYYKARAEKPANGAPVIVQAPEPDAKDKAFLGKYAEHRDIHLAATASGTTAALITSRRSHNKPLDDAMARLETDLTIPRLVPPSGEIEWTDEMRARLIEAYVDSGNLAVGRDAVGCTPSQLWREQDSNPTFAGQLDDARIRASEIIAEKASQMALAGNEKMATLILKAEKPEKYGDRMRLDMHRHTEYDKMSDADLEASFVRTLRQMFAPALRHGWKLVSPSGHMLTDAELNTVFKPDRLMPRLSDAAGGAGTVDATFTTVADAANANQDLL